MSPGSTTLPPPNSTVVLPDVLGKGTAVMIAHPPREIKNTGDPFDVLRQVDGNEALAAEIMGISLDDFYRRLDEDQGHVARGVAVRGVLELDRAIRDLTQYVQGRLADEEHPLADSQAVLLLTKLVPARTQLVHEVSTLPPVPHDPQDPTTNPLADPRLTQILNKLMEPAPIIAGDRE